MPHVQTVAVHDRARSSTPIVLVSHTVAVDKAVAMAGDKGAAVAGGMEAPLLQAQSQNKIEGTPTATTSLAVLPVSEATEEPVVHAAHSVDTEHGPVVLGELRASELLPLNTGALTSPASAPARVMALGQEANRLRNEGVSV
ncbi:hypothetical protein E2562_003033 [Oryza meyeriana var. granulata]|uniref:Uncharacterized protein n=1 Tax=Oryza meyeriana var. granulata TaxID=110450 RepID=A0A6G1DDX7_9ORYZ|nr:hypothetical protein E2562_003033 [Oryza meyeriana var. granulata]